MATTTEPPQLSPEELKVAGNVRAELARRQIDRAEVRDVLNLSSDSIHRRMRGLTAWKYVEIRTLAELMGVELSILTD